MNSIESTGKSVDEAIYNGLQNMSVSIDEVTIEIIQQETKGILGIGAKPAIVRLTQRPPEEYILPDYLRSDAAPKNSGNEKRDRREPRKPREPREPKGIRPPRESRSNRLSNLKAADKNAAHVAKAGKDATDFVPSVEIEKAPIRQAAEQIPVIKNAVTETPEPSPAVPYSNYRQNRNNAPNHKQESVKQPVHEAARENAAKKPPSAQEAPKAALAEYTLEAAKGNPAADFVQGLIDRMGVEGKVLAAIEKDCLRLRIDTSTMGALIGRRGETLDAMQYLTSLVVNRNRKAEGYTRISLNTEDYREKREETLRRLAKKIASQVKVTGRSRALEPMNPYERRVLHATLQSNPFVTTHSEGEEPNRRVVVTPKRRTRQ